MPILILVEKIFPSAFGVEPIKVAHHKPIVNAIKYISKFYKIKKDDFVFEYAVDTLLQEKDTDKIRLKDFNEAFDVQRVFDIISKYDNVILFGSNLCDKVLGKKLSKVRHDMQTINGINFFPCYSSFYMNKNNMNCDDPFLEAYKRHVGDFLHRDPVDYEIVTDLDRLDEVIEYRNITKIACFDFETSSLDYFRRNEYATILSISYQPGYSYVIPIQHIDSLWEDLEQVISRLRVLFTDSTIHKVAHNLKFDMHWCTKYDIEIHGRISDTQLMSHILDENRRHGLKKLTKIYFPFWDGYDKEVDYSGPLIQLAQYAAMDTHITLLLYYIFHAELLLDGNESLYRLYRNMTGPVLKALHDIEHQGCYIDREQIIKTIEIAKGYLKIKVDQLNEFPEVHTYIRMRNETEKAKKLKELTDKSQSRLDKIQISCDRKQANTIAAIEKLQLTGLTTAKQQTKLAKLKSDLEVIADSRDGRNDRYIPLWQQTIREIKTNQKIFFSEVNYNSPDQVSDILYDVFKFPVPKFRGEPKRTSQRDYIQDFDSEFIHRLSAQRTISKMISTYYEGILNRLSVDDMIHASFLQHGTITGRLSGRDPNLQNIPARLGYEDKEAEWCLKQVKTFFITPNPDILLWQADYSQAELRVIANVSQDPVMIQAYKDGEDLHAKTGAMIRGVTLEEFYKLPIKEYKKYRNHAKPANFGWVYKASIQGYIEFAKNQYGVIIDEAEAHRHKEAIFSTYRNIAIWHAKTEALAKKQGYIENLFCRRRRFLNINNTSNMSLINKDIRDAINNPIQGTAGEYTNFCMALLRERLPKYCRLWCTVHDSIFFYIPKEHTKYCLEIINDTCENPPLREYFLIDDRKYPVTMEMEYEVSDSSWREFQEIGKFDKVKEII